MTLSDITNTILEEARERAESIENETEQKRAELREETARQKREMRETHTRRLEREKQHRREQTRARASQEARREIDQSKRDAIEAVYIDARRALRDLPHGEYTDLITRLADELPKQCEGTVTVPEARKDETEQALRDAGCHYPTRLSTEIRGGFILVTDRAEYDYSFGRLLEASRESTELRIAEQLFGDR